MNTDLTKPQLASLFDEAENIAVMPSMIAGYDAFAGALAIYLILKSKEKNVTFIHPGGIYNDFSELITTDEVTIDPSLRDLVVSIDYSKSPAGKVHYSTLNDVLTLKISPVQKDFSLENVVSKIKDLEFDVIVSVGALQPEDFGYVYDNLESEFRTAKVINIDNTENNLKWGFLNLVDPKVSSLSLLVLNKLAEAGITVDAKAAQAILKGITYRAIK
jgi:nanoRNase/pAp phosphatase (c-di-AMP/oligoRNAs hydrolase)